MATQASLEAVSAAAGSVIDPEIGRPLADLNMVGPASVGHGGRVRLQLRLTSNGCPFVGELQSAVEAAVCAVDGVSDIEIDVVAMSADERVELAERLAQTTAPLTGSLGVGGTRIYAVASGKGGVGKSTVTANLAAALAATGKRVGVLDADVWGYSIPQMFGVRRTPVVLGELMLPVPAYGVALMSIGFFVNEEQPVVWRGPMLHKALQQFVADTYWGALDALFVDLPPGTGDATLSLLQLLPDTSLLVVTTPQTAAQVVASRVARMAASTGVPILGVIENMSAAVCAECGAQSAVFGSGGGAQLASDTGAPLLGQIPLDMPLREAGDRGVPVVIDAPGSSSARELARIAATLPTPAQKIAGKSLPLAVV